MEEVLGGLQQSCTARPLVESLRIAMRHDG
jgi:hypothetical protein